MNSDLAMVTPKDAREPLVLTIDVGSSSVRAGVYDAQGRAVQGCESHHPYLAQTTADGGVETDAGKLLELTCACLDEVVAALRQIGRRPTAVACDTFWHSLMGIDDAGVVLTPVYSWADTRSAPDARQLAEMLDVDAIHARTGTTIHSSYLPAKLHWLRRVQPDLFRRVRYWMSCGEYLYLQLFGDRRVSVSMASATGLMDQRSCGWDPALLDALHVEEGQLSPIVDYTDAAHGLQAQFGLRWPELAQLPWFLPLGDGACNNIGSGGVSGDHAVLMVGTSGAIRIVRECSGFEIPPGVWSYRVDCRRIVQGGALSAGGNIYAWLQKTLLPSAGSDPEAALMAMPPDSHGLTILPFLAGERSPHWNPDARSALVGATLDTTPLDLLRASLEAVAYRFGMVYELLIHSIEAPRSIIGSGAALLHSRIWMEIMTDVLGRPMAASGVAEASSRGAALLALEAIGAVHDLQSVPVPLGAAFTPNPERSQIYQAAMDRQTLLYKQLCG